MQYTATYDPADNKLRLYSVARLDQETYARVKAAGFKWAPKQDLFVAPAWTPEREDLLLELAGQIDDEDKSLVKRAEERADRFDGYHDRRTQDAEQARAGVERISQGIPMGQPILVGHHSERHARRDAEKMESGMRRAVRMWETAKYWQDRAAGALAHAKYKELPAVRARRIKGLESDERKFKKALASGAASVKAWQAPGLTLAGALTVAGSDRLHLAARPGQTWGESIWSALDGGRLSVDQARDSAVRCHERQAVRLGRWLAHTQNRLAYERAMLGESGGLEADKHDLQPGGRVLVRGEWVTILKVNKRDGRTLSVTTNARYVRVRSVEQIKGYEAPSQEAAAAVKEVTAIAPLCNYPGEGFLNMTGAEWKAKHSNYKGMRTQAATDTTGRHRVRYALASGCTYSPVFITDEKRKDPPRLDRGPVPAPRIPAPERAEAVRQLQPEPKSEQTQAFEGLKDSLKAGVVVVAAPQLFPTPPDLAARVVELAGIEPGQRVLEPSAGTGRLLEALPTGAERLAVEINPDLARLLASRFQGTQVLCADFLAVAPALGLFDRVVMNPPFAQGQDIAHIRRALDLVRPGGRLVALCANGPRQREALQDLATHWEDLPAGSFKDEGTNVNCALLVVDR